jgi:hypothetical protein
MPGALPAGASVMPTSWHARLHVGQANTIYHRRFAKLFFLIIIGREVTKSVSNGGARRDRTSASITAYAQTDKGGWFRIQMGDLDQWIDLVAQPRHFGGRQWYFRSPITHRCSVLWKPPGVRRFCGRHEWEGRVAYSSQFDTPIDRAHRGKARIKARLIGTHDPDEWELPPKPKWMRWRTYNSLERKFDAYENFLHQSRPRT